MISALAWVPKGVADPTPKKYEMSKAERDLMEQQAQMELMMTDDDVEGAAVDGEEDEITSTNNSNKKNKKKSSSSLQVVLPTVDPNELPPELRMDEYSDDEDNDDEDDDVAKAALRGTALGNLLVGTEPESEMVLGSTTTAAKSKNTTEQETTSSVEEEEEDESLDDDESDKKENDSTMMDDDDDDSSSSDDDDDDDLADIPDTREFIPVDVEGLKAMGLSAIGGGGDNNLNQLLDFANYGQDEEGDDDSDDANDVNLSPNDAILVTAKTEEDFASLEVHVYEQHSGNLFVHHDIPLPSFPLCLAHGDVNPDGGAGNYCAVGTFDPGIEIWNLDVLHALEPTCILGGEDTTLADDLMKANMMMMGKTSNDHHQNNNSKKKKNKKKQKKMRATTTPGLRPGSHTDAILSLSWNTNHRQVLASGSADGTVKLWDVTKAMTPSANAATFSHHKDKVAAVEWHPTEGTLLATGSYDRTIALVDARDSNSCKTIKGALSADLEALVWDPHSSHYLTAASEDGVISCWDVRTLGQSSNSKPVWSFVAEEYGGVTDLTYNPMVPGMLASCAINKTVTLWDTYQQQQQPMACGNKEMNVGRLYALQFYPSSPWLMGCGGGGGQLAIWDMTREAAIQNRFGSRVDGGVVGDDITTGKEGVTEDATTTPSGEGDFEAMMAANDAAMDKARQTAAVTNTTDASNNQAKKKKGKKKKKGAHKRGR